jgi:hypothetical protein
MGLIYVFLLQQTSTLQIPERCSLRLDTIYLLSRLANIFFWAESKSLHLCAKRIRVRSAQTRRATIRGLVVSGSHHKIFCLGMVDNNRRGRLFRFHVIAAGEPHANVLFRVQQRKNLGLIFEPGARRITEGVA